MNERRFNKSRKLSVLHGLILALFAAGPALGEPTPQAVAAFNSQVSAVEERLTRQHLAFSSFLAMPGTDPRTATRLCQGELIIEQLTSSAGADLPGALLHHWRGTAFAPKATAADFERLLRDFNAYPQRFAPEVLDAKILSQQNDHFIAKMRVRQKHVLTVVLDSTYDVTFGRLDARDGYSASRSTQIFEIDGPGTARERPLNPREEHGFLWRLNSYWTYEERDGGLYIQIESISLSRSVPTGLGWAVGPFVERVPRESLEFTLRSAVNAIRK
jgi:hypothetical protein